MPGQQNNKTGQDKVRQDKVRQDMVRQDMVRQNKSRQDKTGGRAPSARPRPPARVAGQRQKTGQSRPTTSRATTGTSEPTTVGDVTRTQSAPAKATTPKPAGARTSGAGSTTTTSTAAKTSADKPAAVGSKTRTDGAAAPKAAPSKPAVRATARRRLHRADTPQPVNLLLVVLSVLTLLAAATVSVLFIAKVSTPPWVDPELLPTAEAAYQTMYTFDFNDPDGSSESILSVLTGDLRDSYAEDLESALVPTYLEVSALTRVDNVVVGLQEINASQTEAVVIAHGTFVIKSVTTGQEAPPEDSGCTITEDGSESCPQSARLVLTLVDGQWLVSEAAILSTE